MNLQLIPVYKQKLKRASVATRQRYIWSDYVTEKLQACLDCTDWNVLLDDSATPHEAAEVVTDYINFCVDTNVPCKTSKVYPNNKPWVSKELRDLMNLKNDALCRGNRVEVMNVQKLIKEKVKSCKEAYKEKIEKSFKDNEIKTAWKTLQTVTDYRRKSGVHQSIVCQSFVNNLNDFYCRFDENDFSRENEELVKKLRTKVDESDGNRKIVVSEHDVRVILGRVKVHKAQNPIISLIKF